MRKQVITLSITGSIKDAIQSMYQNNIRHLILVDKETLAGIITDKDIFKVIISNQTTCYNSLASIEPVAGQKSFRDIFHRR